MQLEIEREALQKEKDAASKERLAKLRKGAGRLKKAESDALTAQLAGREGSRRSGCSKLREQVEQTKTEIEQAERAVRPEPGGRAEVRQAARPGEASCKEEDARLRPKQGKARLLKEEVDEEDIAEVVSRWTGIPVTRLLEGEMQKLLHLEDELHQRVIGQDEAVTAVAEAVIRARSGLKDPNRPIGSVHLPGPDRRRQDRAGARAGRVPVRRRARHDPHRHVGVPGEAHGGPAGRRACRATSATRRAAS